MTAAMQAILWVRGGFAVRHDDAEGGFLGGLGRN